MSSFITRRSLCAGTAAGLLLSVADGRSARFAAWAGEPLATARGPETVIVQSGRLKLTGLLWRPEGNGPFPAVLFNHGGATTQESGVNGAQAVGPLFASHGFLFLFLFRRGHGRSEGEYLPDILAREASANGDASRRRFQLALLTTDHLDDALAGLAHLKAHSAVDRNRIAVAGHSFGGQVALLAAERDKSVRAVVTFAAAALAWESSPELRERLLASIRNIAVPIFLTHAANDYSTAPGRQLAAELTKLNSVHELRLYPPVGNTSEDGHSAVYTDKAHWESDVFAFLDQHMDYRSLNR
jgi:carboxymethylenebutenolidase